MLYTPDDPLIQPGSQGGMTRFEHRSQHVLRARSKSVDVASIRQHSNRSTFRDVVDAWHTQTTATQKSNWANFAANTAWQLETGRMTILHGFTVFASSNLARIQAGLSLALDSPTTAGQATYTPPTITVNGAGDEMTIDFDAADDWTADGGAMLLTQFSPTHYTNIRKGVRAANLAAIIGDTAAPPNPPLTFPLIFLIPATAQGCFKVFVVNPDGRPSFVTVICAAPSSPTTPQWPCAGHPPITDTVRVQITTAACGFMAPPGITYDQTVPGGAACAWQLPDATGLTAGNLNLIQGPPPYWRLTWSSDGTNFECRNYLTFQPQGTYTQQGTVCPSPFSTFVQSAVII